MQLLHVKLLQKQMNKKSNWVADIWFYHYVQNEVATMSCSSYRKCLVLFCRGVGSIVVPVLSCEISAKLKEMNDYVTLCHARGQVTGNDADR